MTYRISGEAVRAAIEAYDFDDIGGNTFIDDYQNEITVHASYRPRTHDELCFAVEISGNAADRLLFAALSHTLDHNYIATLASVAQIETTDWGTAVVFFPGYELTE